MNIKFKRLLHIFYVEHILERFSLRSLKKEDLQGFQQALAMNIS